MCIHQVQPLTVESMFSNKAECRVGGVGVGKEGEEISIKQGAAESKPKELRWQYPDCASLTKQCALNAELRHQPH